MSLSVAFGDHPRNQVFRRLFSEFGVLADALEMRQIGGWEYKRLVPLGGKDRPAPPAFLMPLLIRLVPEMRRRITGAVAAMRFDKPGRFIERWYEEWRPDLITRIEQLRDIELTALDDRERRGRRTSPGAVAPWDRDPFHSACCPDADPCGAGLHVPRTARLVRPRGLRAPLRPVDDLHRARVPAGALSPAGSGSTRRVEPASHRRREHRHPAGRRRPGPRGGF